MRTSSWFLAVLGLILVTLGAAAQAQDPSTRPVVRKLDFPPLTESRVPPKGTPKKGSSRGPGSLKQPLQSGDTLASESDYLAREGDVHAAGRAASEALERERRPDERILVLVVVGLGSLIFLAFGVFWLIRQRLR